VHVHEPTAPSLSLLATWAAHVPVVATFHASMPQSAKAMAVVGGVLRPVLARIDARIAVSQHALTTMQRHLGGTGAVLPNGLWVTRFAEAEPNPAWVSDAGTVAFLGRTDEPRKGLDVLVEAWAGVIARRPAATLLIAGHGDTARVGARMRARLGPRAARSVQGAGVARRRAAGRAARVRGRLRRAAHRRRELRAGARRGDGRRRRGRRQRPARLRRRPRRRQAGTAVPGRGRRGVGHRPDRRARRPPRPGAGRPRAATALGAYDWPVVASQVLAVYRAVIAAADGGRRRGPAHPGDGRTMGGGPTPPNVREATSRD
jgi:phosphatidylinositol alpha-mannosyltransferase